MALIQTLCLSNQLANAVGSYCKTKSPEPRNSPNLSDSIMEVIQEPMFKSSVGTNNKPDGSESRPIDSKPLIYRIKHIQDLILTMLHNHHVCVDHATVLQHFLQKLKSVVKQLSKDQLMIAPMLFEIKDSSDQIINMTLMYLEKIFNCPLCCENHANSRFQAENLSPASHIVKQQETICLEKQQHHCRHHEQQEKLQSQSGLTSFNRKREEQQSGCPTMDLRGHISCKRCRTLGEKNKNVERHGNLLMRIFSHPTHPSTQIDNLEFEGPDHIYDMKSNLHTDLSKTNPDICKILHHECCGKLDSESHLITHDIRPNEHSKFMRKQSNGKSMYNQNIHSICPHETEEAGIDIDIHDSDSRSSSSDSSQSPKSLTDSVFKTNQLPYPVSRRPTMRNLLRMDRTNNDSVILNPTSQVLHLTSTLNYSQTPGASNSTSHCSYSHSNGREKHNHSSLSSSSSSSQPHQHQPQSSSYNLHKLWYSYFISPSVIAPPNLNPFSH